MAASHGLLPDVSCVRTSTHAGLPRQQVCARRPRLLHGPQEVPHLYARQFKSAIGAQHNITLERAISTGTFGPTASSAIVMHTAIYDMIVR
eukprot:2610148-Prymnesium_polylepis.1